MKEDRIAKVRANTRALDPRVAALRRPPHPALLLAADPSPIPTKLGKVRIGRALRPVRRGGEP